jgi:hypothetical protein
LLAQQALQELRQPQGQKRGLSYVLRDASSLALVQAQERQLLREQALLPT